MSTTAAYRSGLAGPLAVFAAIAVFAAALFAPVVMSGPGAIIDPIDRWALSVLALALLVLGLSIRRGAGCFGILAFVFVTGGAAQIYMTEPLWFPAMHLKPQNGREWLMVAVMAVEAAVAVAALSRLGFGRLVTEAGARLGWGRIAIFLGLSFAFCCPVLNYIWRGATGAWLAHVVVGAALIVLHLSVLVAMSQVRSPISGLHRLSPIVPASFTLLWRASRSATSPSSICRMSRTRSPISSRPAPSPAGR